MNVLAFVLGLAAAPLSPECFFHQWWAAKITHFADEKGVPEERYHIMQEGFPPELYAIIEAIKREVYHDRAALARRLERACAIKAPT